ncbi:5-formyltetrahydrofolate cyclo-ligase [Collinsella sp. AGMB00827]|uniref:5-formyltetrahydrofolate cyclo-ligase n=1 Tax=Collinsella ureilytica TaxID=2869515 RepID=A0ABS7MLH1_9ACTN|nr:5-formyltetrahydrofolate cyclo-ligase [Collinsella urealyticum]MBY4797935.1 5-formyltetrahydrofolate cyclo-ligase [Collinsella urealyticum]
MTADQLGHGKADLRTRLRAARNGLAPAERSRADEAIFHRLRALSIFQAAPRIFCYCSFGSEVSTRQVLEAVLQARKSLILPRVAGARTLTWHEVQSVHELLPSRFGIMEPSSVCASVEPRGFSDDLALVPGLAFDRAGFRLGYGGGYYDAFLTEFSGISLGLCRHAQLVDDLFELSAREDHDRPVDMVLTEIELIRV